MSTPITHASFSLERKLNARVSRVWSAFSDYGKKEMWVYHDIVENGRIIYSYEMSLDGERPQRGHRGAPRCPPGLR
jgi:uncharacterized protein YndB with AHSA1/START domain